MLVINQEKVSELLSIKSCISVMETTLMELSQGEALQKLRSVFHIDKNNVLGQMPGYLKNMEIIGTKVITVFPDNYKQGLPSHQGVVLIFDSTNGVLKASVDGSEITAIRTAAVSAIATKLLARKDSKTLSILGSGEQARSHLEAMLLVRPIKQIKVWSRSKKNADLFKREMELKFNVKIEVCDTAQDAVRNSEIICTVTSSKTPILKGAWVMKGAHINAVGACSASERELDTDLVKRSRFYVDQIESTTNESGDYLIPMKEGAIDKNHIIGEIGELLLKKIKGRESDACITIFDSLGLGIEDIAAAHYIYQEAIRSNYGLKGNGGND